MKIHRGIKQGSVEWANLRAGVVTASEMGSLVTPPGKVKTGEGPRTYLIEKLAETWIGAAIDGFQSFDMEQGQFLEKVARPSFTLETGLEVEEVAFVSTDDGRCGCSPDGLLVGREEGIEIKCPGLVNHVRFLLDGKLPNDYVLQVQASMWVTGYKSWRFMSYRRNFTPLILTVERDANMQDAITEAVALFAANFDKSLARLMEINGGAPKDKNRGLKPFPKQTDDGRFDICN